MFTLYHCAFGHRGCTCGIEVPHFLIKVNPLLFIHLKLNMATCALFFNPNCLYLSLSILDTVCVNSVMLLFLCAAAGVHPAAADKHIAT